MNRITKALAALICAAMLCGCTGVPSRELSAPSESETESTAPPESFTDNALPEYTIDKQDVLIKLNAESGVFDGVVRSDIECDGDGYIVLDAGKKLTHIADIPSPQHYRASVSAYSESGAVIKLSALGETIGYYYIPPMEELRFELFGVESLYFPAGAAVLNFECESGSVCLDYIGIENSGAVPQMCYETSSSPVSQNSSLSAISLKNYLTDCYGRKVLTAQNVSPATNAEIDAIKAETGRFPAIRCGELAYVTDDDSAEKSEAELTLAMDWAKRGGIVSYTWHWFSPNTSKTVYAADTLFSLDGAFDGVDVEDIAAADDSELKTQRDEGLISDKLFTLVKDMDRAAEALKAFRDEDIPVLWQPLPESDTDLYWWGGNAEYSKLLWKLMFERFVKYHKLTNLLWVWNGSSAEFCPDHNMVDIVGQTFAEHSTAPFAGRFRALSDISDGYAKPLAITCCDRLPKPEYMLRDNAMWLWFAAGSGEVIITPEGELSERFIDWTSLNLAYNSDICITLDELPDISEYSIH